MKLDEFTQAYLECALWSSTDNSNEQGGDPLDDNYGVEDFAPEAIEQAVEDCRLFQEELETIYSDCEIAGYSTERAGYDFWLTRNHHGADFWDRGLGQAGDRLTEAAHSWGSVDIYVGDNGLLYFG